EPPYLTRIQQLIELSHLLLVGALKRRIDRAVLLRRADQLADPLFFHLLLLLLAAIIIIIIIQRKLWLLHRRGSERFERLHLGSTTTFVGSVQREGISSIGGVHQCNRVPRGGGKRDRATRRFP